MTKIDNLNAIERETIITPPSIVTPLPRAAGSSMLARLFSEFLDLEPLVVKRTSGRNASVIKEALPIQWDRPNARERALARVEGMPSRAELTDDLRRLRAAVNGEPATPLQIKMLVAALLDGIPAARSHGDGVEDAIVCTLQYAEDDHDESEPNAFGFSARVLAAAVRELLAKHTFTPSAAEVLAAAKGQLERYWRALAATNKVLELRLNAEDVVAITDPNAPESDPDMPF